MANFFKAKIKKQPVASVQPVTLSVKIDKLDSNGCGVGQYNRKPLFVAGSLPGEQVEARIIEQKNKFIRAKLINVIKPNSDRVEPVCKHFSRCGGCDLQHLAVSEQVVFKENKISSLFSRHGMSIEAVAELPWHKPVQSVPWHYRRKARIGVQYNKKGQATIGFRERYSNQLTAIKSCPVLVEPLDKVFPLLLTLINQLSVKNAIGHVEVIAARTQQLDVVTTLVIRQLRTFKDSDHLLIQSYAKAHHWQVIFDHGKDEDNSQKSTQNNTQGNEQVNEKEILAYSLGDELKNNNINIQFSHTDFIQVNADLNRKMVEQALDWLAVQSNENVLDLFCGLGNFSLALAQVANKVVGVEGVQAMVDKASLNAKQNGLNNATFYQADLSDPSLSAAVLAKNYNKHHWLGETYNKVLLDPARAGGEQAVKLIVQLEIPTVLYVSCDPETLARDSHILVAQGYEIIKISSLDMFVHTKHIETMVLFEKRQ